MDFDRHPILVSCFVVVLGVLLLTGCFGGCYGCSRVQQSEGFRDGTIRKLSDTGVLFTTTEVEMTGRDFQNGPGETYRYSVTDRAVADQIRELPAGTKVRLFYRKMWTVWQPRGETPFLVTKVERQ